jgi:hypothetical protein
MPDLLVFSEMFANDIGSCFCIILDFLNYYFFDIFKIL